MAASQSQGGENDTLDTRFAELLKPIKDLTQNWEVNLAEILSNYIDDLHGITITLDGGQTSVNFAQAALVLQGTASVYSKKVDFLWQMVLKTLEMLQSKKEGDEDEGGEGGAVKGGRSRKQQLDMTKEFMLLQVDLAKNIGVKNDGDESLDERKLALNFIYITPRQLIEKEGSEQKEVKVNLYMGVAEGKWDILAAKEDFRINSQYNSVTGGLGDDLTEENVQENQIEIPRDLSRVSRLSLHHDVEMDEDRRMTLATITEPSLPPVLEEQEDMMDNEPVMEDLHNLSMESVRGQGQHQTSIQDGECLVSPPRIADNSCRLSMTSMLGDVTPEPFVDPWEPLDSHQQLLTPKPMKPRRAVRFPPSIRAKHKADKEGRQAVAPSLLSIREYLLSELTNAVYKPVTSSNVSPALYDLALKEHTRRREREKLFRKQRQEKARRIGQNHQGHADDEDVDDDLFHDDGLEDIHGDDGPLEEVPDRFAGNNDFDELTNPHLGGDVGACVVEDLGSYPEEDVEESYEELVAKRVAQFVQKSQEFVQSSELTKRVANWHQMIGPRLDMVEKKAAFDVHAYGSGVLNQLPRDQTLVHFNDVVGGKPREEVARYFLSTLMLCNTMNVEVSSAKGTDPELGMDNVCLKLLSTTRHHEQLEGFQATSQMESGGQQATSTQATSSQPAASQPTSSKSTTQATKKSRKPKKKVSDSEDEIGLDNTDEIEPQASKSNKRSRKKKDMSESSSDEVDLDITVEVEPLKISQPSKKTKTRKK